MKNISALFLAAVFLFPPSLLAQQDPYDLYAPVYPETSKSETILQKAATDFLTLPFEIIRIPVQEILFRLEDYQVIEKGIWLYEQSVDRGFTPELDGAEYDLIRIANRHHRFADTTVKGWTHYHYQDYFTAGGKLGQDKIWGTPLYAQIAAEYQNRPEEHFYGLGPDTSAGDGAVYHLERTYVEGSLGYTDIPSVTANIFTAFKKTDIQGGKDGGRGQLGPTFDGRVSIPGMRGDDILSNGIRVVYDKLSQNRGHQAKAALSFNEGINHSEARFVNCQIRWTHYLPLGSQRRILVSRIYGEHNNPFSNQEVPFHQMARLGGFGMKDNHSETLRGFDKSRFYGENAALLNLEYRYTVYEYRSLKVDTVVFFDEGQVFRRIKQFQLSDFRESYGGGFNFSILNNVLLSVQAGHGDEGTQFFVKSRAPF